MGKLLGSKGKFNQVFYPKIKKSHSFLHGIDRILSQFPILVG
jgi:hypothetical protein